MNYDTKFRKELEDGFEAKQLTESSIKLYISNLQRLNDDKPLKNFDFLKNVDDVIKKLDKYKENTKRNYLITIVSSLSLGKNNKLYNQYYDLLIEKNSELKKIERSNVKTDSQKKNWETGEQIKQKLEELKTKVDVFKNNKEVTPKQYQTLLEYMVLALYVFAKPRRNDYCVMDIVDKYTSKMAKDYNYLSYSDKQFVFNKYKNVKSDGGKVIDISPELMDVVNVYIKFQPLLDGKITKKTDVPFLVHYDGREFNKVNSITRILNKIFGKAISSSMIRHIFLSDKYGDVLKDMKQDASDMSHTTAQQADYVKN